MTAISERLTTSSQHLKELKKHNTTADALVSKVASLVTRAKQSGKESSPVVLDGTFLVRLPSETLNKVISCGTCLREINKPGIFTIRNLNTNDSIDFDEVAFHSLIAHQNFAGGNSGWPDLFNMKPGVSIEKMCKVLELGRK